MARLNRFLSSTVGRKVIMAITGLMMMGFLVGHLTGNLLLHKGSDGKAFNDYGHALTSTPLIYVAEASLLVILILHVWAAVSLTRHNREARPVGYAMNARAGHTSRKSVASSTMFISGVIILVFLVFHIVTLKFGPGLEQEAYRSAHDPAVRNLSKLVIEKLSTPWYGGLYVFFMAVLGFHLWHALSSAAQTLGLRYNPVIGKIGRALGVAIALGFLSFPLYFLFLYKSEGV